jgi:hypothetical protein
LPPDDSTVAVVLPLFFHVISFPSTCTLFLVRDDLYYCTCTRTTRFMGFDVSSRAGRIIMIAPRSCAPAPPAALARCWENDTSFSSRVVGGKWSSTTAQLLKRK